MLDKNQEEMLERHRLFVKEICASEKVFGLNDGSGFATCYANDFTNEDGEPTLLVCFWSDKEKALACKKREKWSEFELESITLSEFMETWLLDMAEDGVAVGSNFDAELFGCEVRPLHLMIEITRELEAIGKDISFENYANLEEFFSSFVPKPPESEIVKQMEKEWGRAIPTELRQLIEFQEEQSDFENYSQGFGIWAEDFYSGLEAGWSDDPEFLGRLYPFAQANGSGSTYAIWDNGEGYPMSDMPVVVFGDEGGEWVVADHFGEFLQLLTFDTEITATPPDYCFFHKDEDDYQSDDAELFREWFSESIHSHLPFVDTNEQAQAIVQNAQEKHQQKFTDWLEKFNF